MARRNSHLTELEERLVDVIANECSDEDKRMGSLNDPVVWTEVDRWGLTIGTTGPAVKGVL